MSASWTTAAWLASVPATDVLSRALHADQVPVDELPAVRKLAEETTSALTERLSSGNLADNLAKALHPKLQELAKGKTSDELHAAHDKFLQAGTAFELKFADLSVFFGGLEAQIGPPEAHVAPAMEREHTTAADSLEKFTTDNYDLTTTPQIEWWFVAEPNRDITWPVEAKLVDAPEKRRKPMPMRELEAVLAQKNTQLRSLNEPELLREEGFGARLYTGPMCASLHVQQHS